MELNGITTDDIYSTAFTITINSLVSGLHLCIMLKFKDGPVLLSMTSPLRILDRFHKPKASWLQEASPMVFAST